MSMKTSHKTRRTCTAADGATIPKGAPVDLTADEVILWQQAGKIGASAPTPVPTLISEPVSPPKK